MQASLLTNLLLPLALGIIMLGLGLGLTLDDFRRVARYPRAVLIGLALQTLVLPWAAFGLALGFGLPAELAVGLMLLAASPGGATANIYSHLARGDVALNITLTAINSLLCLLTLPVILNLSLEYFLGAGQYVPPPTTTVIEVAALLLRSGAAVPGGTGFRLADDDVLWNRCLGVGAERRVSVAIYPIRLHRGNVATFAIRLVIGRNLFLGGWIKLCPTPTITPQRI